MDKLKDFVYKLAEEDGDTSLRHQIEIYINIVIFGVFDIFEKRCPEISCRVMMHFSPQFWKEYGNEFLNNPNKVTEILSQHSNTINIVDDEKVKAIIIESALRQSLKN